MLSIASSSTKSNLCSPNILPCQVKHSGPVDAHQRYWDPQSDANGTKNAYFRGRKLQGKTVKVPEGYRGSVLQTTDKKLPQTHTQIPQEAHTGEEDGEDAVQEAKIVEEVASFEDITLWGHDAIPVETEDAYSKGVMEWIAFSKALHSLGSDAKDS